MKAIEKQTEDRDEINDETCELMEPYMSDFIRKDG